MSRKRGKRREWKLFQVLSTPPENPWPQGAVHHGARIGLLVFLAGFVALAFPSENLQTLTPYEIGGVADEDITSEIGFEIPKTPEDLERERAEAEASVPPTFLYRPEARDSMAARLTRFFEELQAAVTGPGLPAVDSILIREGIPALEGQAQQLMNPFGLEALRLAADSITRKLVPIVVDYIDTDNITTGRIYVADASGMVREIPSDELLWGREFNDRAQEELLRSTPELEALLRVIISVFLEPSYSLDVVATDAARNQARQAVQTTEGTVVAGQVIVRRGDPIGDAESARLTAYEQALQDQGLLQEMGRNWGSLFGSFLLNLLLLGIFGLLLFFFRTEVYKNFRWVLLQALLVLAFFASGWVIATQGWAPELIPIAFVALPVALLWDGRMALVLALVLGVVIGVQPPFNDFYVLLVTLVGGGTAALSARAIRRRSQTWIFIALITIGYFLAIMALGLTGRTGEDPILVSFLWAAGNATAGAILAIGFMPVFEWFTGITTDQTLLEWADPNRPLLKRLSMEAGGTYAHTISVANLAEAAATAIGANGLLARVGIYYHDVGKMVKPHYFVENQPGGRNPHDKLKPHSSASIIREHVLEGERMAREEGVPDCVARFIPEHHGTQLIGFFYERAKEESEEDPNPDEFRYPGPRPQSKETAIAMLADSVESATRALQDPSPDRIGELVRTVVEGKIRDGQLSQSPLTLSELTIIQEQFVKVVSGMFHHRLDYPATKHLTEAPTAPPEEAGKGAPGETPPTAPSEDVPEETPEDVPDPSSEAPDEALPEEPLEKDREDLPKGVQEQLPLEASDDPEEEK